MIARGIHGRGTRGRGRDRKGPRVESSSLGSMPNLDTSETPVSPTTEIGSQDHMVGDEHCPRLWKYVEASYIDARRREFLNLTQGNRLVAKYEAKFLRLSCYREREFSVLLEKAKIAEEVKRTECQNRDHERELAPLLLLLDYSRVEIVVDAIRRVVQQLPRGRGQARGGNGMGCGQRAPYRDVITGTFLIYDVPYLALIDIGNPQT
ncbi:Leucine--tRNA ligase [Gossypium arboreum]|uniref:Leucine--tRNA ligase n=1 Tax=Gossypium arboreum TaxID=29729 RepID=A0A0B0P1Q1_GOSAR|nr:Leucine--tRNA ligase [Gossypium arboreum]